MASQDAVFVGITDFHGNRYVVTIDASSATDAVAKWALIGVREAVVKGDPIVCDRIFENSRARQMVVFHGPVTLDVQLGGTFDD